MAGPIKIAILANASQAKKELGDVQTRGQKFSKALGAATKVASVGLLALGAAALKAGKAAAEDEAGQSRLAQTLKTAAGATKGQISATESWITAQGKALGVSDDELRPSIAKLAVATGDVGKAQKLASLAMNVSAGSGKSLETVTAALAKAQTGSLGGLSRLGIATKDASGKTKTLSQVTNDLATKYQGAAGKAAQTTAGKQKILTVQLGELQEQIGAKLLPVMAKLATAGLAAISWATKHGTAAKILLGVMVGLAASVIAVNVAMKVATAAQAVYAAGTAVVVAAQKLATVSMLGTRIGLAALAIQEYAYAAASKVAAAGQWLLNAALTANPIGLIVVAIVALVAAIVLAWKNSATFRTVVLAAWAAIKAATAATFNAVRAVIVTVFTVLKTVITTYVKVYVTVIKAAWAAIKAVTAAVWGAIRAVVTAAITAVTAVVRVQVNAVRTVLTAAWNAARAATIAVWNGIKTAVRNAIDAVMGIIRGIHGRITGVFSGAGGWLLNAGKKIIGGLLDGIESMIGAVKNKLASLTHLIPKLKGPPTTDAKLLKPAGALIIQSLIDGFDSKTPAVQRALQSLSQDISTFSANPTVGLGAAAAYAGSSSSVPALSVKLTAQQISQIQRGREVTMDIQAYQAAGGRRG